MSESKRFKSTINKETISIMPYLVSDKEEKAFYNLEGCVELLNEQQNTIRKLQDLCGESDGENAKLRIENKRLQEEIKLLKPTNIEQYEQIQKLQEENEQLKSVLREECNIITDKDLLEYVKTNGVLLNE